ncbi:MAG: hypothetical protein RLZZ628_2159 [Bacteroidota bacterium]
MELNRNFRGQRCRVLLLMIGLIAGRLDAQPINRSLNEGAMLTIPSVTEVAYGQNRTLKQPQRILPDLQQDAPKQQAANLIEEVVPDIQQRKVQYELPDKRSLAETQLFVQAYQQIQEMLEGKRNLSLKKAIFEAENAWYGGILNYESFCTEIAMMVDIIQTALQQEGHSLKNDLAKKWMLHHFMSDTLRLKDAKGQVTFTHLPYEYDFEDPFGKKDYSQFFVTKLMRTRKGQCRSLPLLYLILAEELGVKAWLAYSPQHSYVRLQDEKRNWYNLELTNGHYSADSWILGSSFIKAEALKNQLYMDTLSAKALIAGTLNELAQGYAQKFGYDPFVLQCAETTLKQHPKDIYALQLKSDYATMRFKYVLHQLNYPPKNQIHLYPKAQQVLQEMYAIYHFIDQTGYEPMPEELYKAWLKSFDDQKGKQPLSIIKP